MLRILFIFLGLLGTITVDLHAQSDLYFPERNADWEKIDVSKAGFNKSRLEKAVEYALKNEYSGSRDLRIAILKGFEREPYHKIMGPVKKRGGPAGMVLKNGYLVTSWGDTERVEMTFSVTKSYLSTVAAIALQTGAIRSVDDPVSEYLWDGSFDGEHNSKITWRYLLNQSSDWYGTLWGGHDWADRPPRDGAIDDWRARELREPGSFFEYNDVRVNLLAYSLLQVLRKPLPMVLKESIMDPIGASATWRWFGYDQAWTVVDGLQMKSVTGGGHSGGGIFINTADHARFGLLFMNNGKWIDQQLIDPSYIEMATTPSKAKEDYGFMWWLNSDRKWKKAGDKVFYAAGFGGNFVIVDQERKLVVVTRWLEPSQIDEFIDLVYDAIED